MRNVLYRVYDGAGELLYVGATTNPGVRLREHHQDRSWWDDVSNITLEHFGTAEELFAAETAAIKAENPAYNHIHSKPQLWSRKPRGLRGEGSIYRRSADGMWVGVIELPPIDGKRRRRHVHSRSRDEVERKFAQLRAELA